MRDDRPAAHAPRSIVCVVAARPNLMKMAPILRALRALTPAVRLPLVHTGQHHDAEMNASHFAALDLPAPDCNLDAGGGSHAVQTAQVMQRFEPVLLRESPAAVLVVGDVNSTLACALVAAKMQVPVLHVEAGLRSGDRAMPEEINRVLTDQLSALLFTSEPDAAGNLAREGIASRRIHFIGNVMIDCLHQQLGRAAPVGTVLRRAGHADFLAGDGGYGLLTLHRPSNVDDAEVLGKLVDTLLEVSLALPLIFPIHPRTRARLAACGLLERLAGGRILSLPPLDYLSMLSLMRDARLVLSDSGGIQEETTALGVPCLTLRENTERPITVAAGTNTLAGLQRDTILALCEDVLRGGGKRGQIPPLWDGHAAGRLAVVLGAWLAETGAGAARAA